MSIGLEKAGASTLALTKADQLWLDATEKSVGIELKIANRFQLHSSGLIFLAARSLTR